MRKHLVKLVMTAVAAFSLLACNNGTSGGDDTVTPTLSTNAPAQLQFTAAGNSEVVIVTTNQATWDVTLTPSDGNGWLTVTKDSNSFTLTATENAEHSAPAAVTIVVTAGTAPSVTITANQDAADLPVYAFGDLYPDATAPVGVVWYIDPASSADGGTTGSHGKIVGLDRLNDCKYVIPNDSFGTEDMDDGQANWAAIVASGKPFGDNTCLAWIAAKGEGWYLPAMNEWRRLYAAMSGVVYEDYADTWVGPTGLPTLQAPFRSDTSAERDAFNLIITNAGGTAFIHGGLSNWTSTEYQGNDQWGFQSMTGAGGGWSRYNGSGVARAMMAF